MPRGRFVAGVGVVTEEFRVGGISMEVYSLYFRALRVGCAHPSLRSGRRSYVRPCGEFAPHWHNCKIRE
ncbi:hypothetical protein ACN23B_30410 (plasmid) [Anabaena sp. FACHB-709]|uniref:Uncharacterized protein n=1 Tax=Anabaena cylindrica FACHB-318 TaxID=2692880 RepID=A0ABR7ZPD8_ANACY|nr:MULTISPECIES: hypothetical protein [Nostocaceae]MBD2174571.1 hypothetical protein [Anabaena cylindrica FACHB-318]MBD2266378.1 hypothetical protein [Anabaena sp. FACHB-709]MBD2275744.1 hypothetical protein [Nostoc sp. PCC 7120 = FACHB-418]MBD2286946.1 hypothetical protein [Anabaena cylindrica FACHB-170]MBD2352637.1 hypothetical protein [Trichormus variabilis FACHB-171]